MLFQRLNIYQKTSKMGAGDRWSSATGLRWITLLLLFMSTTLAADVFGPSDPNIRYMGRIDKTSSTNYVLAFAGSEIETKFNGTSIGLKFSAGTASASAGSNCPDYYNVFIDGVAVAMATASGANQTINYTGLTDTLHTLRVVKRDHNVYQWCAAATSFDGLVTGAGKALAPPDAYQTNRTMLFIGDSWTVGYGDMGETLGCVTTPHLVATNNYIAYGPMLARDFCAQYHVIAETGHGLVNNNGTGPSSFPMPQIFDMVNPKVSSRLWDHNSFVPDVVVVFLGINDCYGGGTSQAALESGWNSFLTTIRSKYPNAEIFMAATASGSSCNPGTAVTNVYNARVGSDPKLSKVIFGAVNQNGCNFHPNPAGEQSLHDALYSVIQTRMGWYSCSVVPTATPTVCGACTSTFTPTPTATPLPCSSLQVDDVEDGNLSTQAGGVWTSWKTTSTITMGAATVAGGTGQSMRAFGNNAGEWMFIEAGFTTQDINAKATVDFDFYSTSATVKWYALIGSTQEPNTGYNRLVYDMGTTTVGWKHFSIPLGSFGPNGPFGSVTVQDYLAGANAIRFSANGATTGAYDIAIDNVKVLCPALPSPTSTQTPSTPVVTSTSTATPTGTSTPSITPSSTSTATRTVTPSNTPSSTSTSTRTVTPSNTPSSTSTSSRTVTPNATPTSTATASASSTVSPSASVSATFTDSPTETPFAGSPTDTSTSTPSFTATATRTATPLDTPTSTVTGSFTITVSGTPTATGSPTNVVTPTDSPTLSPSFTLTETAIGSFTSTVTPTVTPSATNTPVATATKTATVAIPTPSATLTTTVPSTSSPTPTQTSVVPTLTPTSTVTPVVAGSPTFTVTAGTVVTVGTEPFAILKASANPNPAIGAQMGVALLLNRPAAAVEWKVYSGALNVAAAGEWSGFNQVGWHQRSIDAVGLPNGTWFVQLVGVSPSGARTKDVVIKVLVLK